MNPFAPPECTNPSIYVSAEERRIWSTSTASGLVILLGSAICLVEQIVADQLLCQPLLSSTDTKAWTGPDIPTAQQAGFWGVDFPLVASALLFVTSTLAFTVCIVARRVVGSMLAGLAILTSLATVYRAICTLGDMV